MLFTLDVLYERLKPLNTFNWCNSKIPLPIYIWWFCEIISEHPVQVFMYGPDQAPARMHSIFDTEQFHIVNENK